MDRGSITNVRQLSDVATAVEEAARVNAFAQHKAPKAEDVRYAVHYVALGKMKSSKDFTNPEYDRVTCLLELLIEPDNLAQRIRWDHPDQDEKKRLFWRIRQTPEAYVRKLCMDRHKTSDLDRLTMPQLRALAMTLRHRDPVKPQVRKPKVTVTITADNPF
jgi:hypothetical protein